MVSTVMRSTICAPQIRTLDLIQGLRFLLRIIILRKRRSNFVINDWLRPLTFIKNERMSLTTVKCLIKAPF